MILSVFICKNLARGNAYSCGHHPMRLMSLDSIATDGNVVKKICDDYVGTQRNADFFVILT